MPASKRHEGIILVGDDNDANRELLSDLLSAEGQANQPHPRNKNGKYLDHRN